MITVPRPIVRHQGQLQISNFMDSAMLAIKESVLLIVYALAKQDSEDTQTLVAAKFRLAKRGLTIPRLELVAGHMTANLVSSVAKAIGEERVSQQHAWLDRTVALYWIRGMGEYRQFVANRLIKIQAHSNIEWYHVPTSENPADLGSRGGQPTEKWLNGPTWLESQSEAKVTREVLATAVTEPERDDHVNLLEKHTLTKTLRIGAWVTRFIYNCKNKRDNRIGGPLHYDEILKEEKWWIAKVQKLISEEEREKRKDLNLQTNEDGLLECRGRIEGHYPLYVPDAALFST
ncbi:Hypothetical predicted protein [Paramuricea clavata]|uniref:Uncharacterized protein n=1 Tax=Paramuricea clavata TaxID=317549 RepID=A0A6S7J7J0_PARCT|nr:Hypothetical predicted protein [Paramuricea clavata]